MTEVHQFFMDKPGYLKWGTKKLADFLDTTEEDIRRVRREVVELMNSENSNENTIIKEEGELPYTNLEEYCRHVGLDPEKIDPYNHVKYWSDSKGRNRFTIVPKAVQDTDYAELFRIAISEYEIDQPKLIKPKIDNVEPKISVLNLYDAHIDKMSITGDGGEQELQHNIYRFKAIFNELIEHLDHSNIVVFPIGNDLFNTNGFLPETKKGTPQMVIVRHDVTFRRVLNLMRWCIDTLRQRCKEVHVPIVRGNHDTDSTFYLGAALHAIYDGQDDVTIDYEYEQRKYFFRHGILFGFAHGDKEKGKIKQLPMYMATERPRYWGESKTKMFFLGDIHHKEEYMMMKSQDSFGCEVRFLPSIGKDDAWHTDHGWVGANKSAEIITFYPLSNVIVNVTKKL